MVDSNIKEKSELEGINNDPHDDSIPEGEDTVMESNWDETVETFDDLNLKKDLLRGIYGYGFEKPSNIQQKAILPLIKGRDLIAQAQSGTGKTATFAVGCLELLDTNINEVQALVLAPTRELAQQISMVKIKINSFLISNFIY
jgi:translation initiation factor 4A